MDRILKKITSNSKNSLVIVHITDTYFLKESKIGNKIDLPGFARIYGVLELLSKKFEEENILFLHGGDFLFPSFLSNHYKGKQMIDILNQCRLDYCTLGNHDYDGGSKILEKRIHESKFKYLITNLIPPKNISKKILQYDVWPKKNPQIAIVGISGKMTATKATENGFKIKDMKKSLHSTLNKIKKKFPEINLLAVLSHMGDSEDIDLKKNLNNMWSGNSIVFGG
ncbi:MAG: metallophosphoesterase, partial [Nitrosopumilus sp.]|nr:metallophosphoesterase [Nitrosopumilus sp.]